ncbi:hypothetical protein IGI04_002225 [Brassica rapa subsp. trilocularis]|uniref:Uncharacterized protein n=1 Tax=Brassica rapa subsp. trilocularis TaxID=1813537 RepID=A0ABQ7NV22_BRACM|nr:hypothetical protein IGI04_002225 [Brassica rapa subsp. trilocularis]
MVKRNETGHIRPCHIRESYRRRKLQGKVTQRTVPRLFRQIHSCLLNMIYCNDPDPNEVIKNKRGSWERIINYSLLGVFR